MSALSQQNRLAMENKKQEEQAMKENDAAVLFIFLFLFSLWMLDVGQKVSKIYEKKQTTYTELHRRVKILETIHEQRGEM